MSNDWVSDKETARLVANAQHQITDYAQQLDEDPSILAAALKASAETFNQAAEAQTRLHALQEAFRNIRRGK